MRMQWKKPIIVLVIMLIVGIAWFLGSPLFIDHAVDEALVTQPAISAMPSKADVMAMTEAERKAAMENFVAQKAAEPDQAMSEAMPDSAAPAILRRGMFSDADAIHKGAGDALIYRLADGSHLLRLENFKVTNGPALVVYLARHPAPQSADDVSGGYLSLGELKGNVGNQNYPIPADANLSDYQSVVIWCELFSVLFSPAPLSPA